MMKSYLLSEFSKPDGQLQPRPRHQTGNPRDARLGRSTLVERRVLFRRRGWIHRLYPADHDLPQGVIVFSEPQSAAGTIFTLRTPRPVSNASSSGRLTLTTKQQHCECGRTNQGSGAARQSRPSDHPEQTSTGARRERCHIR